MKKKYLLLLKIFVIFLISILALLVRKKNYAEIPIPGQSVDEYSNSWVGLSLIKSGMPIGISGIDGYKNKLQRYVNVDRFYQVVSTGDPLTINYPWMDHPPLLGLITGGYAYLSGAEVFEDTTSYIIRKPIIIISTISVTLLMIYCLINFNFLTAIIAGLIYATTPLVVLSGRMIQAENAIIPCLITCMICISLFLKNKKILWLFLASLISGIATLFKLNGFVCHIFVFFGLLNFYKKINKEFIYDYLFFLAISLPISFLYVIYGFVFGIKNFMNIIFSNVGRFYGIGSNSIFELIRNQRLTQHKFLPEVSIICGWLVFLGYLFKRPKDNALKLVLLGIFSYLLIYIFLGSQPYGWYAFPFWPLLIILLSKMIGDGIFFGKNIMVTFLISLTYLGASISNVLNVFEFQRYSNLWRFGVTISFFILITLSILKYNKNLIFRIMLVLAISGVIYTNLKYLNNINIDFWWKNIS